MDLPKIAIFAVYKEGNFSHSGNRRIYSEIVLLDKTFSPEHPLLYKLHLEALRSINNHFLCRAHAPNMHQHAELISCNVISLDPQKKEITVRDESSYETFVVNYDYLLILNGNKDYSLYGGDKDEALAAALAALQNALKIREQLERITQTNIAGLGSSKVRMTGSHIQNDNTLLLDDLIKQSQQKAKTPLQPRLLLQVQT